MATLLQYDGSSWTPSTVDADVSGGNITNGSLDATTSDFTGGLATDPCLRAYPAASSTTIAEAVTNNSYWYFTLTPDSGMQIDLTSLTCVMSKGGTSSERGYGLRSSIDSYASNIATANLVSVTPNVDNINIDLTGTAYQDLTAAVTFRIYYYGPSNLVSLLTDNLTINGTVGAAGTPPTVTTTSISSITSSSASSGGTITAQGSSAVTDYGVCWNTTGTPTIADSHTHDKP